MSYLTQSIIADDPYMRLRVASAAAQEGVALTGIEPDAWTVEWRRVWSTAPGWDAAWESAQAGGVADPGSDPAVVTDAQILSQIQTMKPFRSIESYLPTDEPPPEA